MLRRTPDAAFEFRIWFIDNNNNAVVANILHSILALLYPNEQLTSALQSIGVVTLQYCRNASPEDGHIKPSSNGHETVRVPSPLSPQTIEMLTSMMPNGDLLNEIPFDRCIAGVYWFYYCFDLF